MNRVRVARSHPVIRQLVELTFPDYSGRKITVEPYSGPKSYDLYWSGGTRDEVRLIDLSRGVAVLAGLDAYPGSNPSAFAPIDQPEGSILAVHTIYAGRDLGVRFIVRDRARFAELMRHEI